MANSGPTTGQNANITSSQLNLSNSVKHASGPKNSLASKKQFNVNQGNQNRGNLLKRGSFNADRTATGLQQSAPLAGPKKAKDLTASGPPERFSALRTLLVPHSQIAHQQHSAQKEAKTPSVTTNPPSKRKSDLVSPSHRLPSMKATSSVQVPGSKDMPGPTSPSGAQSPNPYGVTNSDIRNVPLDLHNQNVVRADAERSRFVGKEHLDAMQQLMTFYCKYESISYKQGINEIMAPFLWLSVQKQQQLGTKGKQSSTQPVQSRTMMQKKGKFNQSYLNEKDKEKDAQTTSNGASQANLVDLEEPFCMTQAFVERFQTNLFVDDEFYHLQACLATFKLLLKYHNPDLARYLEHNYVTCEMYAIPWFITYFSSKLDTADLVIELWDRIAQKNGDVTFIFFFAVALVLENEMRIMSVDSASLPEVMTSLRVSSLPELDQVMRTADDLEDNTPYSFKQIPEIQGLFAKQSSASLKSIMVSLECLTCMPILPAELFFYSFPGEIECPNPECANSLTWKRTQSGDIGPLVSSSVHADPQMNFAHSMKSSAATDHSELKKVDSEDQIQSGITSFISSQNTGSSHHHRHSNSQSKHAHHPLETESNLNYEQDHQESPIDLINETARMKHLNSEDFKSFTEKQLQKLNDPAQSANFDALVDGGPNKLKMPDLCLRCSQRLLLMKQIEAKQDGPRQPNSTTSKNVRSSGTQKTLSEAKVKDPASKLVEADSFEDLSTDLLYSKIRFLIVDCRLNTLQQEVSLPHCLKFEVLAASKAEQLKQQVDKLQDYKDSYHICLLGLDQNHSSSRDDAPDRDDDLNQQDRRISIKKFHEYVLRFIIENMQQKGFKYISSLPGGFQQVHEISKVYGFQLIDHEESTLSTRNSLIQNDIGSATPTLTGSSCYHCMVSLGKRKAIDSQSIVTKRYGSMIDHLRQNTFGQDGPNPLESEHPKEEAKSPDKRQLDKQFEEMDDDGAQVHETTAYQGQKLDLIGFSDYFPFGLRQMYEAASSINRMLVIRRAAEDLSASQAQLPKSGNVQELATEDVEDTQIYINDKNFDQTEAQRLSRYMNQKPTQRQQSSEEGVYANTGSNFTLPGKNGRSIGSRSAGKSGSASRKASYQNQQHLQLQSQYKLMSKVPDFQSQFLDNKGELSGASWSEKNMRESDHAMYQPQDQIQNHPNQNSPIKRNRPRITNEVQPQDKDLAHIIKQMQEQVQPEAEYARPSQAAKEDKSAFDTSDTRDVANADHTSQLSSITGDRLSSTTKTMADNISGAHSTQTSQSNLPVISPQTESYMLNGIIKQVDVTSEAFWKLIQTYKAGHVFSAVRLPARKKTFQLRSQLAFNYSIPSKILITPFTVAVLHKNTDLEAALSQNKERRTSVEEIDQLDFEESDQRPSNTVGNSRSTASQDKTAADFKQFKSGSYATLQSRFFMYDLIKITSRKSTTKIITFYYRIPKLEEYNAQVLEQADILQRLNCKPAVRYAFAFKRQEFEEVSMSFEFELEEDAKMCIASVSSLYKKLKDSQKRTKQRSTAVSDNSVQPATGVEGAGSLQTNQYPISSSVSSHSQHNIQLSTNSLQNPPVPSLQPVGRATEIMTSGNNMHVSLPQQPNHHVRKSAGGGNLGQANLLQHQHQHHQNSASQPSNIFNNTHQQTHLSHKRPPNK